MAHFRIAILSLFLATSAFGQTFTTLVNNGPAANRVDMVFLGDGYTNANHTAGTYTTHVNSYMNYMFTANALVDPYPRYHKFFNVHSVKVVSNQSGCDEPQNGVVKDTALDATYRYDGVTDRLLYINETKANTALNAGLVGTGVTADMKMITVNNTIYGGGGGTYAVYAGGNSSALEVAMHEQGHSFSNLADEYGGFTTTYTGPEPTEVNVTKDPTGAKWARWLGYNQPGIGVIGAYQGGRYYNSGIYRPSNNSKMRILGVNFDVVSREKIVLDIYAKVRPLDTHTPNSSTLVDPTSVSVVSVDDNVIDYQWFIDNVLVPGETGSIFNFGSYSPGLHTVKVRAYDPTGFDPVNGWVRMNQGTLEQFVTWNFSISPVAEPGLLLAVGFFAIAVRRRNRKSQ